MSSTSSGDRLEVMTPGLPDPTCQRYRPVTEHHEDPDGAIAVFFSSADRPAADVAHMPERLRTRDLIETHVHDGVCVARVKQTRLIDPGVITPIGEALRNLLDKKGQRRIVLDLASVEAMSSQMIGELVRLRAHLLKTDGGKLVLMNLADRLQTVLRMTQLDRTLPVAEDEDAAVALAKAK